MLRLADYEKFALETLPRVSWEHFNEAAEDRVTYNDNFKALKRFRIIPRLLRDVSRTDTSTTVLGHRVSFPVCISPTACHSKAHNIAEVGTAQGAAAADTIFTLSLFSSVTLEDVANESPDGCKFFNIFMLNKPDLVIDLVRRAEKSGYRALVVTIDAPVPGPELGLPVVELHLRDLDRDPHECRNLTHDCPGMSYREKAKIPMSLLDASVTWERITWLRSITSLPVILKGILSAEEALKAVEVGAAGILVSNHGGRRLDSVPATIDVLSEIVHAVSGRCEVYMDGGVRTGTDVLKALALGARAVFIGRPAIYALAYNEADGVAEMLQILKAEFTAAMSMAGCKNVSEITRSLVRHESQFPSRL